MNKKKYFISFADSRMSTAAARIAQQAADMNFFDEICVMDENNLDIDFVEKWKGKLCSQVRGFGYWCWKPYIIRKKLEQMQDGELLLYCDVGCHLNRSGVERLVYYVEETLRDDLGIKAFPAFSKHIDVTEKRWTKGDVFDYFGCREYKNITDTPQLASGHIFLRKSDRVLEFVRAWEKVWYDDYALIDDSPSKHRNFSCFIEHRHDQSIFSILYKLYRGAPLPDNETEAKDYSLLKNYPFWDLRDKGWKETRFWIRVRRRLRGHMLMMKIYFEKLRKLGSQ